MRHIPTGTTLAIALGVAAGLTASAPGAFIVTQSDSQTVLGGCSEDFDSGGWTSPGIMDVFSIREAPPLFEQEWVPAEFGNWWTEDGDDGEVHHSNDTFQLFNIIAVKFAGEVTALNVQAHSGNGVFTGFQGGINIDLFRDGNFVGTTVITEPAWTDNSFPEWATIESDSGQTFDEIRFYTPFTSAVGDPIIDDLTWEGLCQEDLDCDGIVGFTDLTKLLGAWGPCVGCPEDLDGDDLVGFTDLTQLLGAWGSCS